MAFSFQLHDYRSNVLLPVAALSCGDATHNQINQFPVVSEAVTGYVTSPVYLCFYPRIYICVR